MLRYSLTTTPPVRPSRLRFGILSAEEVERVSVCEVTETTIYYRGLPASGGLLDPLMGTVNRHHLCATCMRDAHSCEGHSGYIRLAFPVYHVGFVDTVLKTLRLVCFACSRLCVDSSIGEDSAAAPPDEGGGGCGGGCGGGGRARLHSLFAHSKSGCRKACPHCGMPRPTYVKSSFGIKVEWPSDVVFEDAEEEAYARAPFTAREALSILSHIPTEDVRAMGFDPDGSHPKHLVLQNVLVPPPSTRPAIYSTEGSRSRGQNDLTVRLLEILKRSQDLRAGLVAAAGEEAVAAGWKALPSSVLTQDVLERLDRLQYEVFIYVNNSARIPKPVGMSRVVGSANAKTLHERLRGKEGRVRGNLMGKRVDFSARCVITPDAYFECDRIGVPFAIAKTLTVPETVNASNMEALLRRVRIGGASVHGAQTVIHSDGVATYLDTEESRKLVLRPGDVVERFLSDDDVVIFNRQPSLHMHGMQAHRVRLMPGHTFRLSLMVAAPYNADFDGDEMNVHVPQSKAAAAEAALLMMVGQNCMNAQSNRPVMGIVQDALVGLHLIAQPDVLLDHPHACRLLGSLRHAERALPTPTATVRSGGRVLGRWWSGKRLFSCILPGDVYVEASKELPDVTDAWAEDAALPIVVHAGELLCGPLQKSNCGTAAGGLIDVLCRECGGHAAMRFMGEAQRLCHQFLLQRGHHVGISDVVLPAAGQDQVRERLDQATALCEELQDEMQDAPASARTLGEQAILRMLSKTLMQTGGIVSEQMRPDNAIRRMVVAGSKGSFINLSQICACLGQQSLEGKRISSERHGERTLPFFAHQDASLAAKGMVYNSFALGLTPTELFFHSIGGREGLVDTAVKTSQTGYLQRRMNKSMEDHVLDAHGVVRLPAGDVVSFRWGTDGMHPARLERNALPCLRAPAENLRGLFTPPEAHLADVAVSCHAAVLAAKTHVTAGELDVRVLLPFHRTRLAARIRRLRADPAPEDEAVTPEEVAARLTRATERLPSKAVQLALLETTCHARVAGLRRSEYAALMEDLEARIAAANATEAESVGCLAAQSVGEPTTQLTLNTFHYAGCAAKNVTMGIPRLKELIDVSKAPKTPCCTLRLLPPFGTPASAFASELAATLPLTRMADAVSGYALVEGAEAAGGTTPSFRPSDPPRGSKHAVVFSMDQEFMRGRHLTPPMVRTLLSDRTGATRATVTSTEVNSVDWTVTLRFAEVADMADALEKTKKAAGGETTTDECEDADAVLCHRTAAQLMETVVLSGHPAIGSANAAEENEENVVHAYGTGMLSDCVAIPCVDWTRTTSDDVREVYSTLGVEACCHVLFDQIRDVVSFDGTYVDPRHMTLIVDTICRMGTLMPLNRHGINRADTSPLMRCSFEETIDVLCDAGIFSEHENARGVTSSVMTGQLANFGTGTVHVLFPETKEVVLAPRGRVLRSTCRSHRAADEAGAAAETVEYVPADAHPVGPRPLSPPSRVTGKKRARFRPASPPL